jgi:WhiB family redox-sensing transcriptional regulator
MAGEMMEKESNPFYIPIDIEWGDGEWRQNAACKGTPTEDFFTFESKVVDKIKKVCETCPVKKDCLQFALTNDISWGVYGGMTSRERNKTFKHAVSRR